MVGVLIGIGIIFGHTVLLRWPIGGLAVWTGTSRVRLQSRRLFTSGDMEVILRVELMLIRLMSLVLKFLGLLESEIGIVVLEVDFLLSLHDVMRF